MGCKVLTPANAGALVNPVNVARELAFRSLSMAEFGNRKLSGNLPSSPTPSGALRAFPKQRRVRGGWASRDDSLPILVQASDREKTGGEVRQSWGKGVV